MPRKKLKIKNEKVLQIPMTPELYKKVEKYADKHDNSIVSTTGRKAIIEYIS